MKQRIVFGVVVLIALVVVGYLAFRITVEPSAVTTSLPPQPSAEEVEEPSVEESLGGDVYEESANPLDDTLPEFNPFDYEEE